MTGTSIHKLAVLRYLLLFEGESTAPPWWGSNGLSQGVLDLVHAFPRTAKLAAYTRALALAKSLHDERTRAQDVHHLFRLPQGMEAQIHQTISELFKEDTLDAGNVEALWADFKDSSQAPKDAPTGTIDCGELNLSKPKDLRRLAQLYRFAFDQGSQCFPFFTLPQ